MIDHDTQVGELLGLGRGLSLERTVLNGIVSHNDWYVTSLAAAGVSDIADRLKVS